MQDSLYLLVVLSWTQCIPYLVRLQWFSYLGSEVPTYVFQCKDKSSLEASKESTFFLVDSGGILALDTSHAYCYHV